MHPSTPNNKTLIVFSHLRWGFVYQRPQHLMSRLSQHYHVLFVEEPVFAPDAPHLEKTSRGPSLDVLVPRTTVTAPGFHDDQFAQVQVLIAAYLRENGVQDYAVWFYTPMALPLLQYLRPRAVVYDCMDELSAFKNAPPQLQRRETELIARADLMFTGGPALFAAKRLLHDNIHCLPSSVDANHYAPHLLDSGSPLAAEALRLQGSISTPRLGFFGVIDERFDLALLQEMADAHPEWQLMMVGPVVKIDPAQLPHRPNVHWLGMQSYNLLPYLMAGWDVCLMPFALNAATRFISPTKTLEYMAGEKPVVSTAVHDVVALYGEHVRVGAGAGFIAECEAALAENAAQRSRRVAEMRAAVQRSSWDRSAQTVQLLLDLQMQPAAPPTPVFHILDTVLAETAVARMASSPRDAAAGSTSAS